MYLATILAAQTDFGEYPRVWFDQRIQKAGLRFAEGLCSKLDSKWLIGPTFVRQSINRISIIKQWKYGHLNNHAFGSRFNVRLWVCSLYVFVEMYQLVSVSDSQFSFV